MARYRHYKNHGRSGEWVFVTTTCLDFVHAFDEPTMRDLMSRTLIDECRLAGAVLHGFVVMPHHVHFIVAVPQGRTISQTVGRIKSVSARNMLEALDAATLAKFDQQRGLNRRMFWQRSFRSFVLTSKSGFLQKLEYLHDNPVRAGLVERREDYCWSSARHFQAGLWNEEHGLTVPDVEYLVQDPNPQPQGAEG